MADFSFVKEAFGEDNETKIMFLKSLKEEIEKYRQAIVTAIQHSDDKLFEETVHKLKPQVRQLGENGLIAFLDQNKDYSKLKNNKELEEELHTNFNKLISDINNEISTSPT